MEERLDNLIWLMESVENTYVKDELIKIKEELKQYITEILCENN